MNKYVQRLFLFEKHEIQTKLSKSQVLKRIESFADPKYSDYYGFVSDDSFTIAEKSRKSYIVGHTQNSFVPVARAKIDEKDGMCKISVVYRMNLLVLVMFAPFYIASLILIVPFPFMLALVHFAFVKPAIRLKEALEDLLTEK